MLENDWTQNVPPYGNEREPYRESEPAPAGADDSLPEPQPLVDLPRVDVAGVINNPSPPPDFVWDGLVPRGHVCLLSGHGGSGKSTLALQLAVATAMGLPLLGIPTRPGRVLFFSGEDAGPLLRHRLAAVCRALDVNPHALAERLLVLDATESPALGESVRDRETGRDFIAPTTVCERLWEILTEYRPALVVVDNASDVFEANENDRSQVRGFMRSLAKICRQVDSRPAILLLTHTPKQAVGGRGESYSGSTAWHNSARARLTLTPDRDNDSRLILTLDKMNLAPLRREPLRLVRSHGGVLALDGGAHDAKESLSEPPTTTLLRLLADFNRLGEHVSPEQSARNNAWKMLQQEDGFPKRTYRAAGPLFAAMRELERRGLIERAEYVNAHRKRYEQWLLTAKGWAEIGESAPTAPTAPTSGVGALDAGPRGGAPTAPTSGPRGCGGIERAQVSAQEHATDEP
jgi:hypothetical protein